MPAPGVLALEGPGALARFSGPSLAGVEAALGGLWERVVARARSRRAARRDAARAGARRATA